MYRQAFGIVAVLEQSSFLSEYPPALDHIVQGWPVLPLEVLDPDKSIVDFLQALRRPVGAVADGSEEEGQIFELRLDRLTRFDIRREPGIDAGKFVHSLPDLSESSKCRLIAVVQGRIAFVAQSLDAIGAGQKVPIDLQRLVLARQGGHAIDFAQLEREQFEAGRPFPHVHLPPIDALTNLAEIHPGASHGGAKLWTSGKGVKQWQVVLRIEQELVFVLAVQFDEPRDGLAQRAGRREGAVDEGAIASAGRNFPSSGQLASVCLLEERLDRCQGIPGPDQVCRGSAAKQQSDGLDEHRLARAGLTRQDSEAVLELDVRGFDDREAPDAEKTQHLRRNSYRIIRLTAVPLRVTLACPALSQRRVAGVSEASLHTLGTLILALQVQEGAPPVSGIDALSGLSPINLVVLAILILLSVVSWAITLQKWLAFRSVTAQTVTFLDVFRRSSKFSDVQAVCPTLPASPLVGVFQAGYAEITAQFRVAGTTVTGAQTASRPLLKSLPAVDRALLRASTVELNKLERRITLLATVASAAPFIGLFGTVWGIMVAFGRIGATGSTNLAIVAPGISEALVATAAGLAAAIPAVFFYNHFTTRVKGFASDLDDFSLEFLNIAERNFT